MRAFRTNFAMSSTKIVVMGSGGVGKSCLTVQFVLSKFVDRYEPTIEDSYRSLVELDGEMNMLEILDTAGTEHFVAMRDMYIKQGQAFVLVYSVTSPHSLFELEYIRDQIEMIHEDKDSKRSKHGGRVPIVLVGNKCDLVDERRVTTEEGKAKAEEWGCMFVEASAKSKLNVREVFLEAARQAQQLQENKKKPKKSATKQCTIL